MGEDLLMHERQGEGEKQNRAVTNYKDEPSGFVRLLGIYAIEGLKFF